MRARACVPHTFSHVLRHIHTQASLCAHTHSCTGTSRQEGPHPRSPPLGTPSPASSHTLEHQTQPQTHLCNVCERDWNFLARVALGDHCLRWAQGRTPGN